MALETLQGKTTVGGYAVNEIGRPSEIPTEQPVAPDVPRYVTVDHTTNTISVKIQNGPIKEAGVNGAQIDTLIELGKAIIDGLNTKFPCRENSMAITKLDESLMWLDKRTKDRVARNVEGTSKT